MYIRDHLTDLDCLDWPARHARGLRSGMLCTPRFTLVGARPWRRGAATQSPQLCSRSGCVLVVRACGPAVSFWQQRGLYCACHRREVHSCTPARSSSRLRCSRGLRACATCASVCPGGAGGSNKVAAGVPRSRRLSGAHEDATLNSPDEIWPEPSVSGVSSASQMRCSVATCKSAVLSRRCSRQGCI